MRIIETKNKLCLCCMEIHDVQIVEVEETTTFKEIPVKYFARYEYCDRADELLSGSEFTASNDIAMKNAYRKVSHLLTTDEIIGIRNKYDISQKDLACILGWGEKTITRYEGHQVQDAAHDFVLRKVSEEPGILFEFLKRNQSAISADAYQKYKAVIERQHEKMKDLYLRKAISAEYLKYQDNPIFCGNEKLNFDKVIAVVNYFAKSKNVKGLFKVKLMKLLWYADFLSYKRHQHSITGLVYTSMPMGAVPVGHKSIINLNGIQYEEIDFENGSGIKFKEDERADFTALTEEDLKVLDAVIAAFGNMTKNAIVSKMHEETAYKETKAGSVISYEYARLLSLE